jgi:serine-type D-Ala-D-Ala carboxypeptidase/endopeptidase (penicillin-binding protein 4)
MSRILAVLRHNVCMSPLFSGLFYGLLVPLLVLLAGCATPPMRHTPLPAAVQQALLNAGVSADALAVVVLPLGKGPHSPGFGHQADKLMQPASTMKLVTSVVALDQLGPNLRGFTELRSAAPQEGAVLMGDLVLKGGADPDLGVAEFWALLQELRHLGVRSITGNLVIDRTLWRPARLDVGLPPFDDAPEFPYNMIPDALQLAGNLLPISLASGSDGVVRAATVPALMGISFESRMQASDSRCNDWDDDWLPATVATTGTNTQITLNGRFPKNCTQRAQLQLIDRLELAERLFRTLWLDMGGQWAGRAVESASPANTRLLARRLSRTWGEVLRPLNKSSDNALTRMLFLNLGVAAMASDSQSSTLALADQAVRRWFAANSIDASGMVLDNGSGLSRSERISPLQMARLLQVAHSSRYASDLMMSLPTAGVDGTMRNRLKTSPAMGWARLKTGTLRDVTALAGYVSDAQGQPWAVAMMINHDKAAAARSALDALVDHIARFGAP